MLLDVKCDREETGVWDQERSVGQLVNLAVEAHDEEQTRILTD